MIKTHCSMEELRVVKIDRQMENDKARKAGER